MDTVLAALITGSLALVGVILSNSRAARAIEAELDRKQAVTDTKLDELTREVRAHNNFAQRVPVLEEKLDGMNRRIRELEAFKGRKGGGRA